MIEETLQLDLAAQVLKKFLPAELHENILTELKAELDRQKQRRDDVLTPLKDGKVADDAGKLKISDDAASLTATYPAEPCAEILTALKDDLDKTPDAGKLKISDDATPSAEMRDDVLTPLND